MSFDEELELSKIFNNACYVFKYSAHYVTAS